VPLYRDGEPRVVAERDAVAGVRERLTGSLATGLKVVERGREARVTFLAAAVAYFVAVSLLPLAVLVVVIASLVGGTDIALTIIRYAAGLLGPQADGALYEVLTDHVAGAKVTLVGLPVLAWGALRTFRSLDAAFEEVYGVKKPDSLPEALLDAAVVFGATTLGAALMVGIGVVLSATTTIGSVLELLALFLSLVVVFYPMYYLFPNVDPAPTEVLPGTLFTAGTWTGFQVLFQLVAVPVGRTTVAGTFGAVILTLTWLYVGSLLLLVGATLDAVVADRVSVDVESAPFPEYG
jgi:membrane protein